MGNILIDGIEVIVSDVNQYLQINDISGSDLAKIWGRIKSDYTSYEKWICYHNYDEIPFALLEDIHAVLEDDCIETRLTAENFIYSDISEVVRITEEKFEEFADYHDKCNPECGAKSERIKQNFSRWGVFVMLSSDKITDYIIIAVRDPKEAEIFCVEASDNIKYKALITSAAKYAFDNGKTSVLCMADENTIVHKAALSVGFANEGFYKGYRIM